MESLDNHTKLLDNKYISMKSLITPKSSISTNVNKKVSADKAFKNVPLTLWWYLRK